jgi:hypothetical protein
MLHYIAQHQDQGALVQGEEVIFGPSTLHVGYPFARSWSSIKPNDEGIRVTRSDAGNGGGLVNG